MILGTATSVLIDLVLATVGWDFDGEVVLV